MACSTPLFLLVACSAFHLTDSCATNQYSRQFFCDNQEKLCEGLTKRHSGCGSGKWAETCSDERSVVEMTDNFKSFILDLHNTARSKTARGKMGCGLGAATRMVTMEWDPTLARLALNNVKKCSMHHSTCVNTPEFKNAGQNVGFQSSSFEFMDNKDVAKLVISQWVDEYQQATTESIRTNPDNNG